MADNGRGFYMQYLESLCRRRGWHDPAYDCRRDPNGFWCLVTVNEREYRTDLAYESNVLAQENAAMRAFMVCRSFSVDGGMLIRNGIIQGVPANPSRRQIHTAASSDSYRHRKPRLTPAHSFSSNSSSSASFNTPLPSPPQPSCRPAATRRHGLGHGHGHGHGHGQGHFASLSSGSVPSVPDTQAGYDYFYSHDRPHAFKLPIHESQADVHCGGQYSNDSSSSSTPSLEGGTSDDETTVDLSYY